MPTATKRAMLRLAPHPTRVLAWLLATACAAHAGEATETASGTADQFKLTIDPGAASRSQQNTIAAINRRMRGLRFNWPDAPRRRAKIRSVAAAERYCKTAIISDQTCSGSIGSYTSF